MTFTLLPTSVHIDCRRALLSVIRVYASGVKRLSPFRGLKDLAEHVAQLCDGVRPIGEDPIVASVRWQMENACSLAEYESKTTQLDHLQGHDAWKAELTSVEPEYDSDEISHRISAMKEALLLGDAEVMQRLICTSLSRDLGGTNLLRLYKHSWFGTKRLVDEYIDAVVVTIESMVQLVNSSDMVDGEVRRHRDGLRNTLKFYGSSALTLSGGGVMGMKHVGVAKCLWESYLLPDIISGASAGSIVAAIIGSATDEEMPLILDRFPNSDLAVFDPEGTRGPGWSQNRIKTFLQTLHFFNPKHLKKVMKDWLGDTTFREAYNKTKRTLNICVSNTQSHESLLLNYVTAPDVYIWSAVCASCAVPGVFPGADIYEKDYETKETRLWMQNAQQIFVDGSLDADIPARKLAEMFNVNLFIVSQVNPHVRPALTAEETFTGSQPTRSRPRRNVMKIAKDYFRQGVLHYFEQFGDLGLPEWAWRWTSLLNQQYTGHINILPEINLEDYMSTMANPTPEFMRKALREGERATWPKICRIQNCVDIELALIRGARSLSERLHFSPGARAARELERLHQHGSSRRGRSAQPHFLRRRSSSTHSMRGVEPDDGTDGSLAERRNNSAGNVRLGSIALTPLTTLPTLSPQAGIDEGCSEGLMMTSSSKRTKEAGG